MDRIPDNGMVKRNTNGVCILRRRIPYDRQGRNRRGASGSTFFSLEEGGSTFFSLEEGTVLKNKYFLRFL